MADSALDKLKRKVAWQSEPVLTADELDAVLEQFAVADSDGFVIGDDDWIPTYNLRAAAREGWSMKMGKAAALISTDLDGDRMSANQIFDQCERMFKRFSGTASVNVTQFASDDDT